MLIIKMKRIFIKWRKTNTSMIWLIKRRRCLRNSMYLWCLCKRLIVSRINNYLFWRIIGGWQKKIECIENCIWEICWKNLKKYATNCWNRTRKTCKNIIKTKEKYKIIDPSSTFFTVPTNQESTSLSVPSSLISPDHISKINICLFTFIVQPLRYRPNFQKLWSWSSDRKKLHDLSMIIASLTECLTTVMIMSSFRNTFLWKIYQLSLCLNWANPKKPKNLFLHM